MATFARTYPSRTWRLKNVGTCPGRLPCTVVFDGELGGGPVQRPCPIRRPWPDRRYLAQFGVASAGSYRGFWFQNASGVRLGREVPDLVVVSVSTWQPPCPVRRRPTHRAGSYAICSQCLLGCGSRSRSAPCPARMVAEVVLKLTGPSSRGRTVDAGRPCSFEHLQHIQGIFRYRVKPGDRCPS
jgi:hypothetical protein